MLIPSPVLITAFVPLGTPAVQFVGSFQSVLVAPVHKLSAWTYGRIVVERIVARNAVRYGGLVAFTGGLIGPPGARFVYSGELSGTACFLGAGDRDPHVPWKRVEETASVLSGLGAVVTLRRYPGLPHTINEDEIDHAKTILRRLIVKDRAV